MQTESGFTLIELAVALAIAGILLAVAAPSWNTFVQNNRLTTQVNDFVAALRMTRVEAIKRSRVVEICVDIDLSDRDCDGANWGAGWRVWVDENSDNTVDTAEVLRIGTGVTGSNTLTASGFADNTALTFNANGSSDSSGTFTFCDPRGAAHARAVIITLTGNPRLSTDDPDDSDTIHEDAAGNPLTCP